MKIIIAILCLTLLIFFTVCKVQAQDQTEDGGNMKNSETIVNLLEQLIAAVKNTEADKPKVSESTRLKMLSDGWVLDKALGLEWGPSSEKTMNFAEAEKYAADLGGRLPKVKELHSLVDYEKRNPAIDTKFFKDTKTDDWYWTSTVVAGYSSSAWVVNFYGGYVDGNGKDGPNYVRPVRSSQCLII